MNIIFECDYIEIENCIINKNQISYLGKNDIDDNFFIVFYFMAVDEPLYVHFSSKEKLESSYLKIKSELII